MFEEQIKLFLLISQWGFLPFKLLVALSCTWWADTVPAAPAVYTHYIWWSSGEVQAVCDLHLNYPGPPGALWGCVLSIKLYWWLTDLGYNLTRVSNIALIYRGPVNVPLFRTFSRSSQLLPCHILTDPTRCRCFSAIWPAWNLYFGLLQVCVRLSVKLWHTLTHQWRKDIFSFVWYIKTRYLPHSKDELQCYESIEFFYMVF
jgi:hypothetical protein